MGRTSPVTGLLLWLVVACTGAPAAPSGGGGVDRPSGEMRRQRSGGGEAGAGEGDVMIGLLQLGDFTRDVNQRLHGHRSFGSYHATSSHISALPSNSALLRDRLSARSPRAQSFITPPTQRALRHMRPVAPGNPSTRPAGPSAPSEPATPLFAETILGPHAGMMASGLEMAFDRSEKRVVEGQQVKSMFDPQGPQDGSGKGFDDPLGQLPTETNLCFALLENWLRSCAEPQAFLQLSTTTTTTIAAAAAATTAAATTTAAAAAATDLYTTASLSGPPSASSSGPPSTSSSGPPSTSPSGLSSALLEVASTTRIIDADVPDWESAPPAESNVPDLAGDRAAESATIPNLAGDRAAESAPLAGDRAAESAAWVAREANMPILTSDVARADWLAEQRQEQGDRSAEQKGEGGGRSAEQGRAGDRSAEDGAAARGRQPASNPEVEAAMAVSVDTSRMRTGQDVWQLVSALANAKLAVADNAAAQIEAATQPPGRLPVPSNFHVDLNTVPMDLVANNTDQLEAMSNTALAKDLRTALTADSSLLYTILADNQTATMLAECAQHPIMAWSHLSTPAGQRLLGSLATLLERPDVRAVLDAHHVLLSSPVTPGTRPATPAKPIIAVLFTLFGVLITIVSGVVMGLGALTTFAKDMNGPLSAFFKDNPIIESLWPYFRADKGPTGIRAGFVAPEMYDARGPYGPEPFPFQTPGAEKCHRFLVSYVHKCAVT